jgi:hypothetical protein
MSTEKIVSSVESLQEKTEGAKLQRVFGVLDATAHIVGGIIGSGIFVSPKVLKIIYILLKRVSLKLVLNFFLLKLLKRRRFYNNSKIKQAFCIKTY